MEVHEEGLGCRFHSCVLEGTCVCHNFLAVMALWIREPLGLFPWLCYLLSKRRVHLNGEDKPRSGTEKELIPADKLLLCVSFSKLQFQLATVSLWVNIYIEVITMSWRWRLKNLSMPARDWKKVAIGNICYHGKQLYIHRSVAHKSITLSYHCDHDLPSKINIKISCL